MVSFHPFADRLEITLSALRIAKNSMLYTLCQRIQHQTRRLKIHICNPERKYIRRLSSPLCKVKFQTVCISSIYYFIKFSFFSSIIILPLCLRSYAVNIFPYQNIFQANYFFIIIHILHCFIPEKNQLPVSDPRSDPSYLRFLPTDAEHCL